MLALTANAARRLAARHAGGGAGSWLASRLRRAGSPSGVAHRRRRRPHGHTLVELLVVLAIVAILLGGGLPAAHALLQRQQLRAAANDVYSALAMARSLAIARGGIVVVAPHAGGWRHGWTVFADRDGDGHPGAGDETIARQGALADGIHIRMQFTGGAAQRYIAYNADGRSCRADRSNVARWGTLTMEAGTQQYLLRINMLGRARLCDPRKDGSSCSAG